MVVPDWFYNLLVKLGLIDTEEKKLRKQLAKHEESRRKHNQNLNHYIKKISDLEAEIKVLRPEYESAHGPAKNLIGAKIKPLLQELNGMKEKESLISQDIKDLTSLIHTIELQLQHMQNQDLPDKIEDMTDVKKDLVEDVKEQQKASGKLNDIKLPTTNDAPDFNSGETEKTENFEIDFSIIDDEKVKQQEEA